MPYNDETDSAPYGRDTGSQHDRHQRRAQPQIEQFDEGDEALYTEEQQHHHHNSNTTSDGNANGGGCCAALHKALAGVRRAVHTVLPPGGVLTSALNMASVSIGAGILGIPSATDGCGLAMALIYIVCVTVASIFTMSLIGMVCRKTQLRSYEATSRYLFPQCHYAFSYLATLIRWIQGIAGCVAYVISMMNCLDPIFKGALRRHPNNKHIKYLSTTAGLRLLTSMIWLCVMLPLVIPKHIDSLRYASTIAVAFMIYFVVIIVVHSCTNGLPIHKDMVIAVAPKHNVPQGPYIFMFREGNPSATSVGVFFFVFLVQINSFEIYWDMRPEIRDTKHFTLASVIGLLLAGGLYILVAIFGYFDFGSEALAGNSILLMYDPLSEPAVMVAYVGVFVKLCVAYAMLTLAARNSTYYLIGWQEKYRSRKVHLESRADYVRGDNDNDNSNDDYDNSNGNNQNEEQNATNSRDEDGYDAVIKPSNNHVNGVAAAVAAEEGEEVILDDGLHSIDDGEDTHYDGNGENDERRAAANSRRRRHATGTQSNNNSSNSNSNAEGGGTGDDLPAVAMDTAEDTSYIDNIPFWKHIIAVLVLSVITLLLGLFVPKINMVLGFSGGICGGSLAFLFPALFFMYSGGFTLRKVGVFLYVGTYVSLVIGVIGIVWGTAGTIYDII